MKPANQALSEEETSHLKALLQSAEAPGLWFARGVFAAVGTTPTLTEPGDWLTLVLGKASLSDKSLREALALLMREYNACLECLELGVPVVPKPEEQDAIERFAKGYVQIAQSDTAWKTDQGAFLQTLPLTMLSGYVQPSSLKELAPEAAADPNKWSARHQAVLGDDVAGLFQHFKEKRETAKAQAPAMSDKLGRNDPCPCGSGKKFKKCCGKTQGS